MPSDRKTSSRQTIRQEVRQEDWATLLRQMGGQLDILARHPFLRGDLEAESRLRAMLRARDLEALDKATDHLADYLTAKRDFQAALEARRKGLPPPPPSRSIAGPTMGRAEARRAAVAGPSGDDFELGAASGTPETFDRRGRLRL